MVTNSAGRQRIKNLQVRLAEHLIQIKEGSRLPSVRKLATSTHMSVGSVSIALNELQDMGAVRIEKHGHLGSIVEHLSLSKLWNVIEPGPVVIAMTLPMHLKFEGLATGLKMAFEKAGIDAYMIFIRGSLTRLKALRENRCHMAVMSGLAAAEYSGKGHKTALTLPPGSWISGYRVFYRNDLANSNKPLRVGIDRDSFDHRRITELEFEGQNVEYHWESFVRFYRLLRNGDVDAIVWTIDQGDAYLGPHIAERPLTERAMDLIGEKSISATLITHSDNESIRTLLGAIIQPDEIVDIQNKVVHGEIVPEY